jgi:predicted dehydrogenase
VTAIRQAIRWDHNWIRELSYNGVHHIILYDFGVHWFDFIVSVFGNRLVERVYATVTRSPAQLAEPPLLGQVLLQLESAQASVTFDADTRFSASDTTTVIGTAGVLNSSGPTLNQQRVSLQTAEGICWPDLVGSWFPDGFQGAMAELIWAVDQGVEPLNGARENLRTLAVCAAAMQSADSGVPIQPQRV